MRLILRNLRHEEVLDVAKVPNSVARAIMTYTTITWNGKQYAYQAMFKDDSVMFKELPPVLDITPLLQEI